MQLRDPLTGRLRPVRAHPFGFLAMGATVALIPWTLIYITQLPDRHTTDHWNVAWTGFDILLALALGVTAWSALRERAMLIVGLIVSSTLLVCDAWFDVVTSFGTDDQTVTLITALGIELPLAFYFAAAHPPRARHDDPHQPAGVRGHRVARRAAGDGSDPGDRQPLMVRATAAKAAIARSTSSSESAAESCVRMRACPMGTTG